jgi:toxin ParE1/3/4
MSLYTPVYTSSVNLDVAEALDYIRVTLENPIAAKNHYEELQKVVAELCDNPHIRPVVEDAYLAARQVRSILVKQYYLFYRIDEEAKAVILYRFIHSRRDWSPLVTKTVQG